MSTYAFPRADGPPCICFPALRAPWACLVHGLEDEPELLGGAHESDDVLEGEVDDAEGVDHVQDGDHRRVAHHLTVLVLVAVRVLLRQAGLGTCIMQNVCIYSISEQLGMPL